MNRQLVSVGAPLIVMLLAGCSDNQTGRVSFALTSQRPNGPAAAGFAFSAPAAAPSVVAAGDSTVIALGNDTIILRSVQVVLREIELKRVETVECDAIMGNDDCEEFETGPVLVSLPLGTTATETVVSVNAPAGMYDELEFEVHKPEAPEDAAFIAAHPTFDRVSMRVSGTYSQAGTRSDFTFTSDLNAKQEVPVSLTVSEGVATNVTLRIDVATWFLNAGGTALVNPASANKGQPNENIVRDHVQASIDAFRDNDRDGHDDDREGT
jgi:hypothetical protein